MGTTIGAFCARCHRRTSIVAMSLPPHAAPGFFASHVLRTHHRRRRNPTRFVLRHPEIGRTILHGAHLAKTLMRVVMVILTGLAALSAILT